MNRKTVSLAIMVTALFTVSILFGQTPKTKTEGTKKEDTLVVIARIVEIPGKFVLNDVYNYVYVMKYRVVKVERGTYAEKEILVGQYNPLIPRKKIKEYKDSNLKVFVKGDAEKFEVGGKQRLTLITPIEKAWSGAVEDEYIDSNLEKYFALKTDVVK